MAVYLLDTSVIIDTINGKRNRGQLLEGLVQQDHLLACCSINVTEVYAGLRPHEESRTMELLQSLQYYPVTFPIARLAGLLKRDFSRKGISLATTDVTIAAVAIHHHLTLLTDNLKHYPMKDLSLYPLPTA
jgi:predicted nucleic acid-binding protein